MHFSERPLARFLRRVLPGTLLCLALASSFGVAAQAIPGVANEQLSGGGGPVRLSQPAADAQTARERNSRDSKSSSLDRGNTGKNGARDGDISRDVYRPSEFEQFVRQLAGLTRPKVDPLAEEDQPIRRFGVELLTPKSSAESEPVEPATLVPDDYLVGAGDELVLNLWGAVEGNLRLTVDRSGRIVIPRVGAVSVAGLRFADLKPAIAKRVANQFRNFELSVGLGQVRGMRVYVTGFVQRPGAQTVGGLSTVLHGLMAAGGPTAVGSLRNIQLRRGGVVVGTLDLYDLLLRGDRSADRALRSDDVIHVGPVGAQVGVIGSVNKPAVFELKAGETIADALAMAGGLSTVANRNSAVIHRLDERAGQALRDVKLSEAASQALANGDVLRALSMADMARPVLRQSKRVRVDGEVQKPGDYVLPANSTLADALQAAGGLTAEAYVFGAEFTRESVRLSQMENYDRTLRDLESEYTRIAINQKDRAAPPTSDAVVARSLGQLKLIERLRTIQPTGRVVLQMQPQDPALPELALEDGDRLHIPAKPSSVNVYGSVFNSGSYVFIKGRSLDQYVGLAGGVTRSGDGDSMFVLRANGSVVSNRSARAAWMLGGGAVQSLAALPGDTVFVPEDLYRTNFMTEAKDWAQILYQFGLGAAALKSFK
jgi:protein involved in polysaccharide export with SLBB domain